MSIEQDQALARRLVTKYQARNKLYKDIDDIFYLRGGLPEGLPDWVQEVKSTEPRDAVMTAARVLSTLTPQFHITPMLANEHSREWANKVEMALKWNYVNAGRRAATTPHWQLVLNSVRYAQPVIQVVYLPYQNEMITKYDIKSNRVKASHKFGDFAYIIHDPGNVYPMWSDYGLEGVLLIRLQTADDFKATWGSAAKDVKDTVDKDGNPIWVSSFDLYKQDRRKVWVSVGEGASATKQMLVLEGGTSHVILDDENDLGFIPISVRRWGDDTSSLSDQQVMPLLSGIAMAGQWEMLNVLFSLDTSLAWKRAAQPIGVHTSPTRQPPEMDYTEPAGTIEQGPGESFQPLPPPSADERVASQYANVRNLVWQSTVARALQSLEFPGNTAYSTVNQVLQAATQSISPYRVLSEESVAEAAHIMLCWLGYWGEKKGEDVNLYGMYPRDNDKYGDEIIIPWQEIDPYEMQINVILRPDIPLDRQQQVNTAAVLYERFPIPAQAVLEDIGFENINLLSEQRHQEDMDVAYMQAENARPLKELELEYQAKLLKIQAQINQEAISQQLEMQQNAQANASQNASQNPTTENNQGLGNNPAQGGGPPMQGAPGQMTREAMPQR